MTWATSCFIGDGAGSGMSFRLMKKTAIIPYYRIAGFRMEPERMVLLPVWLTQ
ncbi:MAG: hypothetical protein ACLUD2_11265 [Clostridium sp.]